MIDAVKSAASALDRAASKGTIPARRASRQKGRIAGAAHKAAKAAGATRLMFTVSLASDPVRTVELFGEHVLPKL